MNSMGSECAAVHEEFEKHTKAADQIKVIVENYFDSVNTSFDNILNLRPTIKNREYISIHVAKANLDAILIEQNQWLVHLKSMKIILKWYNEQRLILVEYIVELRNSFAAERNEI